MANSVEIRSPLLDYRLVEFVSRLPEGMKYDGNPKSFYKECLKGIVPDSILYARKRGFEPPWPFIREMTKSYRYKHIEASHGFYNSMVADKIIDNLLPNV
jgi:asparagine synthase (glutamine-hydrolysing)